ncbi:MAG: hypothetical protein COA78_22505 [Blastopirellula sp.]|nr:MAG: hypothetical protein COA78_22505 [Blastopirellula sp.]
MFFPKHNDQTFPLLALLSLAMLCVCGCGTTTNRILTDQLVTSNAVDVAIARIDFRLLSGEKVFLDTQYLRTVKGIGFVNADYIVSSLRQQITAAGCLMQDTAATSDYVIEARVGALGVEGHQITYGIPASTALSSAASIFSTAPPIPTIPEISLAKRNNIIGAAKIGLYAYHRETREPVWQSGIVQTTSNARDFWILGAGPFQSGSAYNGLMFAGTKIEFPTIHPKDKTSNLAVDYKTEHDFRKHESGLILLADPQAIPGENSDSEKDSDSNSDTQQASFEEDVPVEKKVSSRRKPEDSESKPKPKN